MAKIKIIQFKNLQRKYWNKQPIQFESSNIACSCLWWGKETDDGLGFYEKDDALGMYQWKF